MLPRITNHNYTLADHLSWSSKNEPPRDPVTVPRDQLSAKIYDDNHNPSRPRIISALEAADVAVQYMNQAKLRQDYYFDRAEKYHQRRYQEMRMPLAKLKPVRREQRGLIPIGQNFGYPEKRCFDPSVGGITFIPRHGDGTTADARVGDYGQPPPSGIHGNDVSTTKQDGVNGDIDMMHLKYFR